MRLSLFGSILLLVVTGCTTLGMPKDEIKAKITAWENLRNELQGFLDAPANMPELRLDAVDWTVLALELDSSMKKGMAQAQAQDRHAQHSLAQGVRPAPPGPHGGMVPLANMMAFAANTRKARDNRELATLRTELAAALMGMADMNKRVLQGKAEDPFYVLYEVYNIGIWAITKYTDFLKEKSGFSHPDPVARPGKERASKALRAVYGI